MQINPKFGIAIHFKELKRREKGAGDQPFAPSGQTYDMLMMDLYLASPHVRVPGYPETEPTLIVPDSEQKGFLLLNDRELDTFNQTSYTNEQERVELCQALERHASPGILTVGKYGQRDVPVQIEVNI